MCFNIDLGGFLLILLLLLHFTTFLLGFPGALKALLWSGYMCTLVGYLVKIFDRMLHPICNCMEKRELYPAQMGGPLCL